MAQVDRLTVRLKLLPLLKGDVILPRVVMEKPRIYLHRERSGRANWTFANTRPTDAPARKPPKLPVIRHFLIDSGTLIVADDMRKLRFDATVQAHETFSREDSKPFKIEGKGNLNDQPFLLRVAGGPLINLDPDRPYSFDLRVRAGDITATSSGEVLKPFDLGKLRFKVSASGNDLADFYYLTQLALPNTPPFKFRASIERDGKSVRVSDIAGTVGASDVAGELAIDMSRKRAALSGNLTSKHLRLSDLAASLGSKPKSPGALQPPQPVAKESGEVPRLFPDARLQVERVRGMDADVRFAARSIRQARCRSRKSHST